MATRCSRCLMLFMEPASSDFCQRCAAIVQGEYLPIDKEKRCSHGHVVGCCIKAPCKSPYFCVHGHSYRCVTCADTWPGKPFVEDPDEDLVCVHGNRCRICFPEQTTISRMYKHAVEKDTDTKRYDPTTCVTTSDLRQLLNTYKANDMACSYCGDAMDMSDNRKTMLTITRINKSLGFVRGNCTLLHLHCEPKDRARARAAAIALKK